MQEIWKDVKGYEGYYQISNYGRLKSFKVDGNGKILKLTNKNGDYFSVVLQGKGKERRSTRIHRLVAEAFIPNPDNKPQINHIDGNKQNNHINNLEWCTSKYNIAHAIKTHPEQLDEMINYNKHIRPKKIVQMDTNGNILNVFDNAISAGKHTNVCSRNILQCASFENRRHTAGGFVWRFEGEEDIKTNRKRPWTKRR